MKSIKHFFALLGFLLGFSIFQVYATNHDPPEVGKEGESASEATSDSADSPSGSSGGCDGSSNGNDDGSDNGGCGGGDTPTPDPCPSDPGCVDQQVNLALLVHEPGFDGSFLRYYIDTSGPNLGSHNSLTLAGPVWMRISSVIAEGSGHAYTINQSSGKKIEFFIPETGVGGAVAIGRPRGNAADSQAYIIYLDAAGDQSAGRSGAVAVRQFRSKGGYVDYPLGKGYATQMTTDQGREWVFDNNLPITLITEAPNGTLLSHIHPNLDTHEVRQLKTPAGLLDVVEIAPREFEVRKYAPSQITGQNGLLFEVSGTPIEVLNVKAPEGTQNQVTTTVTKGSFVSTADYTVSTPATGGELWLQDVTQGLFEYQRTLSRTPAAQVGFNDFKREYTLNKAQGSVVSGNKGFTVEGKSSAFRPIGVKATYGSGASSKQINRTKNYHTPAWAPNAVGRPTTHTTRAGFTYQYSYDADQRMTQRTLPFAEADQVQDYIYAPLEPTEHVKLIDYRPRTTTRSTAGQVLDKTYTSYFYNAQNEYVERREEAIDPSAAYGDSANRRTETIYYGSGQHKGRRKSQLNSNGTLTTFSYQDLTDYQFQTTTLSNLTSTGQPFEGKSLRTVLTEDERGWDIEKVNALYTGGQWVDYERIVSTYNNHGRLTNRTRHDLLSGQVRVLLEQEWDGLYRTRHVDEYGVARNYTYNQIGLVTSMTREAVPAQGNAPAQEAILTTYTGSFQMTSKRYPQWKERITTVTAGSLTLTSRETYDAEGRVISSTDVNGYTTTMSYSDNNLVTTTTQPNGGTVITTRAPDGKILSRTGSALISQFYTYAPAGAQGGVMTTTFTGLANSTRKQETFTDMLGRTSRVVKPSFTGTDHITEYFYNASVYCGPSVVTRTDQPTLIYEYDALCDRVRSGQTIDDNVLTLASATDRITDSDTLAIVDSGKLWSTSTTTIYPDASSAAAKQVSQSRRLLGGLTGSEYSISEQYDIVGNLTRSVTTLDRATRLSVATTSVPTTASAFSNTSHAGRHIFAQKAGEANPSIIGYDALGRMISQKNPRHTQASSTAYLSGTSLIESVSDAAGNITSLIYGAQGSAGASQVTTTTRPDGTTLRKEYDLLGREVRCWGTADYPKAYTYNLYGDMTTLTTYRDADNVNLDAITWPLSGATGDTTTWNYHIPTGLMAQKLYADGNGPSYEYFIDGQLARRTWARGVVTDYAYTGFDQLLSTTYSNDPANTPNVSQSYDRLGRTLTTSQGSGASQNTISHSYDSSTLLPTSETQSLFGGQLDRTLDRSYDAELRPTGFQLKKGGTIEHNVAYDYLAEGQLGSVTSGAGSFNYSYEANNRALKIALAGPVIQSFNTYEINRDHLVSHSHQLVAGGTNVASHNYVIDSLGRRSSVTENGSAFASAHTVNWNYNTRDEVSQATHSTDTAQNRSFDFDSIGNRKSVIEGTSPATAYIANALNQYTTAGAINPVHDADGNATSTSLPIDTANASGLEWDAENRLVKLTRANGNITQYWYDAQSRRIRKQNAAADTWFVYDGWNMIAEYNAGNSLAKVYTWGSDLSGSMQGAGGVGGLLAVTEGGNHYYPTCDANGNVGTYLDASGTVVAHYEYDAFGKENVAATSGSLAQNFAHRFSTKYHDEESGLYYYGYRYYDPNTGRWPSRDPIGEVGGPTWFDAYDYYKEILDLGQIEITRIRNIARDVGAPSIYLSHILLLHHQWVTELTQILFTPSELLGGNNLYGFAGNDGINKYDELGLIWDTIWDAGVVVYDICKGDWDAAAADALCMCIPFVPAGGGAIGKKALKGGGKNAKHANQKARDVAKEKLEKAKEELQELKSKPNKTKQDKKAEEKKRKEVKNLQKKADFTGENHSQKNKR